ncbi:hypothetical protein RTH46_02555 [Pseudomonas sp. zfem004]|uniref:hypothetical protein n=1 Tax=Pseudomonas sp. zfem004 TaxID=3078199 RepID=UPI002928198A|nr:hypothetical protein [Pseudomonas sp. zfem004]MDU9401377.1 hypothetical protein [Pseudomonas sp. zfem004]
MNKQTAATLFFYQNGKLITVKVDGDHHSIFRNADIPMAELQFNENNNLLATDDKGSVLVMQGKLNEAIKPGR